MGLFRLKDFPGRGSFPNGIHPPENKEYCAELPVEVMPTPEKIILPLLQNIGAPCEPLVKANQEVSSGELIGKGKGYISAALHSPVRGKVQKIGMITLPNGRHLQAVFIKPEGDNLEGKALWDDVYGGDWPRDCPAVIHPQTIADEIRDAGIVGLGGAAFPTHVKLAPDDKKMIDTLMINGCECEPYLTADYRLMVEAPDAIISGALFAGRATQAKEIVICIEDNKPKAIEILKEKTKKTVIQVVTVKTKYPQGSEKHLIKAVLDLEVPMGGLPSDVGVAMSNVATIAAVGRALIRGKPLTHRIITVTGAGITTPKNLLVPIGVTMGEVIAYCGGLKKESARLVAGGPMMGFSFSDMDAPVTKGTNGITVLTNEDILRENETSCVRCGRCVDVCPMRLVPTKLALAAKYKNLPVAQRYNMMACFECGCCTYVCPAHIRLVQLIRSGKALIAASRKK
jgi:Na+-translocating ferredoxin:NAD+ oxidoreductase subunit C